MSDLIDRQAALNAIDSYLSSFTAIDRNYYEGLRDAKRLLDSAPSAQPRPRGMWLPDNRNYYEERFVCSVCRKSYEVDTCIGDPTWDFCPGCGADMRQREEEQE